MPRISSVPLFVFVAWFGLSACNLPVSPACTEAPAGALTVGVSAIAECRSGPGQEYTSIAALEPGQVVQAVGRSPAGDYLLIQHSSNPVVLCWLMTASAAVVGDPAGLPQVSVPAPPSTVVSGCPSPIGGGPSTSRLLRGGAPPSIIGCPSPIGGGPTPITCSVGGPPLIAGCPSPVGGGPDTSRLLRGRRSSFDHWMPESIGGGPTPITCSIGGPLSLLDARARSVAVPHQSIAPGAALLPQ